SPGSSSVSITVGSSPGSSATLTAQYQPGYAGRFAANASVTTPSSATRSSTSPPIWSSRAISSSAARATRSRAPGSATSGVQVVRDATQHRGDPPAVGAVRVASPAQVLAHAVEQRHEVLDHDDHVVGGA